MTLNDGKFEKSDVALIFAIVTMAIFNIFIIYLFYSATIEFKITGEVDAGTFIVVFLGITNSVIVFVGLRQRPDKTVEKLLDRLIDKVAPETAKPDKEEPQD